MTIGSQNWPYLSTVKGWAKILGFSTNRFLRAERTGKLVGNHPNKKVTIYTRDQIVSWLNLDQNQSTTEESK
jgi:hypothetical protein